VLRKEYSVTAINNYGSYSITIYITVNPAAPKTLVYDLDSAIYKIGVPIFENNPSYTGGAPSKFETDKALPTGLRIDAAKGTIYGTPTKKTAQSAYTVTASNVSGSASATVIITVDSGTVIDTTVAKPLAVKAVRIDTQRVRIWWNKAAGADVYIINRSIASRTAGYQLIKTASDTFCVDSTRFNGFYYINSRRGSYTSPASDTVAVIDTINTTPVNRPPVIVSSLSSRTIKTNAIDTIVIIAADPDTDQTLSMKLIKLDSLRSLFGDDSSTSVQWTAVKDTGRIVFRPRERTGMYRFTIQVSDGINSVSGSITVYVGNVNRAPEWVQDTIRIILNDGVSWEFSLADSCNDPDSGATIRYRFISDSLRSAIPDGRFTFSAGTLDTLLVRSIAIEASDGELSDTIIIKITILPVYFTLAANAQNGSVTLVPDKTSYRTGESVRLTGVPSSGYEFARWTGDLDSSSNPLTLVITKSMTITANFRRYNETDCETLSPGASINAKIEELSALPSGSLICPAAGKYDNGTLEVEGKVTIQVKGSVLY